MVGVGVGLGLWEGGRREKKRPGGGVEKEEEKPTFKTVGGRTMGRWVIFISPLSFYPIFSLIWG